MIARLDDPWFEARFLRNTTVSGFCHSDRLEGSDGLSFWCPCGYGKPEFPIDGARPHEVIVSFANPRGCAPAPANAGSHDRNGAPSRWTIVRGSGISDLTLNPSIDVGEPSCWHGFVEDGIVR